MSQVCNRWFSGQPSLQGESWLVVAVSEHELVLELNVVSPVCALVATMHGSTWMRDEEREHRELLVLKLELEQLDGENACATLEVLRCQGWQHLKWRVIAHVRAAWMRADSVHLI